MSKFTISSKIDLALLKMARPCKKCQKCHKKFATAVNSVIINNTASGKGCAYALLLDGFDDQVGVECLEALEQFRRVLLLMRWKPSRMNMFEL